MVPNSSLPSSVPSDSSSIAALDSQVNQEELRSEVIPSPALEAREKLEKTAAAAKYGVHTKSASDGADVRWYFCKTPLRPNGTVHSTCVCLRRNQKTENKQENKFYCSLEL